VNGVATGGLEADLPGRWLEVRQAVGGALEEFWGRGCWWTVEGLSSIRLEARQASRAVGGAGEECSGGGCWGNVIGLLPGVLAADNAPLSKVNAPRLAVGTDGDGTGAEGSGLPPSGTEGSGSLGSGTEGPGSPASGKSQKRHFPFLSRTAFSYIILSFHFRTQSRAGFLSAYLTYLWIVLAFSRDFHKVL